MPYRFALTESPDAGLRRIAREQTHKTVARLTAKADEAATVHETRKSLKRMKALFKLVRRDLPKQVYAREYGVVRDVARALSGARDLEVMPVTLASLAVSPDVADRLQLAIERAQAQRMPDADRRAHIATAARRLKAASRRYDKLLLRDGSFAALAHGAADGLRLLRRQHDLAVTTGQDDDYHDWRKSAQLHWRQLRLLSEVWPALIAARIRATKSLAAVLGHDHDLSVLADFVETVPGPKLRANQRTSVLCAIRMRQQTLRTEARACAGLLVVDKPKTFAARLCAYHSAHNAFADLPSPYRDPFKRLPST